MKKDPIGPPPNRKSLEICLYLFDTIRAEARYMTDSQLEELHKALSKDPDSLIMARLLVNYLKEDR